MFVLAVSLGIVSLESCKKCKCQDPGNPDCENYDPCHGKSEVKATFIKGNQWTPAETFFGTFDYVHDKDSVYSNSSRFRFSALTPNAKYTWKLGAETITDSTFVRSFSNVPEGWYEARLVVESEPNKQCFPDDNGKDTLVKRWYMMPRNKFPIIGAYKVLFEGATDSSIIQVRPWEISAATQTGNYKVIDFQSEFAICLLNFRNGKDTLTHFSFKRDAQIISGHWIGFNDKPNRGFPFQGYVRLDGNQVEAEYQFEEFSQTEPRLIKFKGRKIE